MSEWMWAPVILVGLACFWFGTREISVWIGSMAFRDESPEFRRYVRRRFRRAWSDGARSIGFHR